MNTVKTLLLAFLVFFVATGVSAQNRRQRAAGRPIATKRVAVPPAIQPTTTPSPVVTVAAPVLLAIVNGQNVTTADIDPKARQEAEALAGRIHEARRQILELQINTLLLESEAAKRKLTSQQLYDMEVTRKIGEPSAAEVSKFIEDNRDQMEETDPAKAREQVVAYLRGEREAQISGEVVKRLRASNPVVENANLDVAALSPSAVVATVAGHPLTAARINERLKPIIYKLILNTYLIEKEALDLTINDLLLLAEANRRNVPPEEIVRKEISEKVHAPTEAEIAKFYADNKAKIPGELAAVSSQIGSYLQEQDRQRLE